MKYTTSLLRTKDYYPEEPKSLVDKWLTYKQETTTLDLDLYPESFYKTFWPELTETICTKRETMTSVLVTFQAYATFKGFKWKKPRAKGIYTFTNFLLENSEGRDERLGQELITFIELATSPCNMIPVPSFFNAGRSGPFAKWDYWDLTLVQIKKWFTYREMNEPEMMKDALRLLFAHSTHDKIEYTRSTNMYDSIYHMEKWLTNYHSFQEFVRAMYLDSFVDKNKDWQPILFWDTHCFELPLPTDVEEYCDGQQFYLKDKIDDNFSQFFNNVNRMLLERGQLLLNSENK